MTAGLCAYAMLAVRINPEMRYFMLLAGLWPLSARNDFGRNVQKRRPIPLFSEQLRAFYPKITESLSKARTYRRAHSRVPIGNETPASCVNRLYTHCGGMARR
jgi:hypothetical protein